MSFGNYALQNGQVAQNAVVTQIGLIACLYRNDQTTAQSLMNLVGGGEVVKWTYQPNTWPPSWAVLQQDNDLYVVITGTTNAQQYLLHLAGVVAKPYHLDQDTFVHSLWDEVWNTIGPQIKAVMPADLSTYRIHCTGHSYGGALAVLAANDFASLIPRDRVELLTYGAPRVLTQNYRGPSPQRQFRIVTSADIVPYLPPMTANLILSVAVPVYGDLTLGSLWWQYGERYEITDNSTFIHRNPDENNSWLDFPELSTNVPSNHSSDKYASLLSQWWASNFFSPDMEAVVRVVKGEVSSQSGQNINVDIPQGTYINLQTANVTYFSGLGQPVNAGNLASVQSVSVWLRGVTSVLRSTISEEEEFMASVSGKWKFTIIMSNGATGNSETVCWNGTQNIQDAIVQARGVCSQRSNLLGSGQTGGVNRTTLVALDSPKILFCRVVDALNPRYGQLVDIIGGDGTPLGQDQGNNPADVMSTAVSIRVKGLNVNDNITTSFSNHLLVGQPDDVVEKGAYNGTNTTIGTGTTYDTQLKTYLNFLTNPANALGYMGLGTQAPNQKQVGINFKLAADNHWQITVANHGYSTGDKVKITKASVSAFNGTSKINVIDTNTIELVEVLPVSLTPATQCNVQRVQLANGQRALEFYAYKAPLGGWASPFGLKISKKDVARPFSKVTFRRRRRLSTRPNQ